MGETNGDKAGCCCTTYISTKDNESWDSASSISKLPTLYHISHCYAVGLRTTGWVGKIGQAAETETKLAANIYSHCLTPDD